MQLTGATFDTWLRGSAGLELAEDVLTVQVGSERAQDWLEHRMLELVQRVVTGIAGRSVAVRFVVLAGTSVSQATGKPAEVPLPDAMPAMSLPDMPGLGEVGYFPVSRYECRFWAPFLGRVGWRVWEIVRGEDVRREKSEWTTERRWSAPGLARLVPCGPQAIVGVTRLSGRQLGALERLEEAGVGRFRRQGDARDPHTMYVVSVRVRLPLLTPVAVMSLSDTLRQAHDRWLEEYGFDPRAWFVGEK